MALQPQLDGMNFYSPRFGGSFLADHAGRIMTDPHIAIVELVANSWDAGANEVHILWPEKQNGLFEICDNGTGMTEEEFRTRWPELSFNRIECIGSDVIFPVGNESSHRKAFGRNGKGRHSVFCFSSEYLIETWCNGVSHSFKVVRTFGHTPFQIIPQGKYSKDGNGTLISAKLMDNYISISVLKELIGSKFFADPSFYIFINHESVEMMDLKNKETEELLVDGLGAVLIHRVDSQKIGRTSQQHGVAWWVNRRLVGEQSWKGIDDTTYLDARTSAGKRYTFVVEADILADEVMADWSWFKDSPNTKIVLSVVKQRILDLIRDLMEDVRRERKVAVIESRSEVVKKLSPMSRYIVGKFLTNIQIRCPTITPENLSQALDVLANLEASRSGYALLEQLAKLKKDELDKLNDLLKDWTVQAIQVVLDELRRRLSWIKQLESLAENAASDELHQIQPLFERGLWIFGPEFEGADFIANRWLATIIREFFKGDPTLLTTPERRPDIVTLSDSSISIYETPSYDERGEPDGVAKVLIIELKRGGFEITRKERQQAQDYANEIRKSGKIQRTTRITGFVLGSKVSDDANEPVIEGETIIYSRPYSTVLRQAHARTFNLLKRLEEVHQEHLFDADVEKALGKPDQLSLGLDDGN